MFLLSPLEQFFIFDFFNIFNFKITNFLIGFYFIFFLFFLSIFIFSFFNIFLETYLVNFIFLIIDLIILIIKENIFFLKKNIFFFILVLFLFLLTSNFLGLIPFSYTLTSQLFLTFYLTAVFFFSLNIIGIFVWGLDFVLLFLPSGVPVWISPLLIIIEFISYFGRLISLSVRIFANLLSGHALLKILIMPLFLLTFFDFSFFFLAGIILIILFLESVIAFLQAYVFVLMVSLYNSDVLNFH